MSDEKFLDYQKPKLIDMTSIVAHGKCDYGTFGYASCAPFGGGADPYPGDCVGGGTPQQPAECSTGDYVEGTCNNGTNQLP